MTSKPENKQDEQAKTPGTDTKVPEQPSTAPKAKTEPPAPAPKVEPKLITVKDHITPMSHPGAQMQYMAGQFYQADAFLLKLWHEGDPIVEPYAG